MENLTQEQAKQRITDLKAELKKNEILYYVQDMPAITDAEYDGMREGMPLKYQMWETGVASSMWPMS